MIDGVLDFTRQERLLDLDKHAAWQILHGVLAYGKGFEVARGSERHQAVQWVLDGGAMAGWSLRPGPRGVIADLDLGSKKGQGHADQWLAVIAQCDLPSAQTVVVGTQQYTIGDLLSQAMYDTYQGKECSWTLIALSTYLTPEQEWQGRDGNRWTLERMIAMEAGPANDREQAAQHINEAACGGSHRLIGMTMALNRYRAQVGDQPLTAGWATAQQQIDWAIAKAREHQLPSGAFSVQYFRRASGASDLSEHIGATGHTLEFLSLALDETELSQPWVERGVVYLCELFDKTRHIDLECGALYHAAHALVLYRERRFGPREHGTEEATPPIRDGARTSVAERPSRDGD